LRKKPDFYAPCAIHELDMNGLPPVIRMNGLPPVIRIST
jgi:hypothetical protein